MQLQQPTVRLALLLRGLNRSSFEELPWQVGRKTVNAAAAAGLVEVEPEPVQPLRPRCRLTELGVLYRAENRYVFE
jgi:DNA-binding HxlR family transcriptional regulator